MADLYGCFFTISLEEMNHLNQMFLLRICFVQSLFKVRFFFFLNHEYTFQASSIVQQTRKRH